MNQETNHEKRRGMRRGNTAAGTKLLYAALAGGGIAALLTYYFAPKSWSKFTREITGAARKGWNQIEKSAEWVGEEAQTFYGKAKSEAGVIYDAAAQKTSGAETVEAEKSEDLRQSFDDKKQQISSSFEAGKKMYNRQEENHDYKAAAAKTN